MLWRNFKMAISSIGHSKTRSFLTMLGIIIGVSSVITVLATGEGIKRQIVGESERLGATLINITPGQLMGGEGESINFAASLGVSTLTEEDVEAVRNIESIEAAAPIMLITGSPSYGGQSASGSTVMATTTDLVKVLGLELAAGRFFSEQEEDEELDQAPANQEVEVEQEADITEEESDVDQETENTEDDLVESVTDESTDTVDETVLGFNLSKQFFDEPNQAIGETITIRNRDFTVVGVLAEPAESFAFSTDAQLAGSAFLAFATGTEIAGGVANIIEINALATSTEVLDDTVELIKTAIRNNHDGEEDFTVLTLEEFADFFDDIFGMIATFIAAIAGISLLVGGIGVANIMLVTVTERTREIGIRKAVGATRGHIMMQFLIEAMVLSLIGGALGVLTAFGFAWVIQSQAGINPVFTPFAFLLALGVSLGVGVIFGLVPAFKAARKNPIEALRYE